MHLTTGFRTYLYCFETENIRIVCPIAEREFDGYIDIVTPYGFPALSGTMIVHSFPTTGDSLCKSEDTSAVILH